MRWAPLTRRVTHAAFASHEQQPVSPDVPAIRRRGRANPRLIGREYRPLGP